MGHGPPACAVGIPRNSLPPNVTKTRWGHSMDRLTFVRARAPQLISPAHRLSKIESVRALSPRSHRRTRLPRRRDGSCPALSPHGPPRDHARIPRISSASGEIDALVHLAKADVLIRQEDPIGSRGRARVSRPRSYQDIIEEKCSALHLEGFWDHSWCYFSEELKKYPCPNRVFMIY
jgi:hypothetical protein